MKAIFVLACLFMGSFGWSDEEGEECETQPCHHHHYHFRTYDPEEEKLIEDRTESYWPGKRENSLLEELTR